MKKMFILISTLFIFSCAGEKNKNGYIVSIGDLAPDFTIVEAGGNTYRLSDLRGSVVMLQFTASWCGVCRQEMPFIEEEIWHGGKESGLKIIGIDRDEPVETVSGFKEDMKISYPLALDPGADIFGLFANKEEGVTRNVIIDRNGRIIYLTRLFDRKEFDGMKERIFEELDKK
ncbi:MAG TPA: TlpA disulfide reductase family protein [Bacteroidales bacterium]|nr:TlpA disulfide reductase family protein [Bacteroidales bacterium]